MLVQEFINTTTALTVQQGVNNSNNLTDVLFHDDKYGFNSLSHRSIRMWILFIMAMVSSAGHVLALVVQYNSFSKRNYLWLQYFVTNVLYSGIFLGYIPMLSQISFEVGHVFATRNDTCQFEVKFDKYVRPFFHTFSNYGFVSLAIASYQVTVKGYLDSPISLSNCFITLGGLYVISSIPALLIYFFRHIYGMASVENCSPYFFEHLPFSCGTRMEMVLMLTLVYLLPMLFIIGYYFKILSHVWSNSSYLYTNKRDALSISDCKYIKMAFLMCLLFVLSNVPFLLQLIVATFFPSVTLNPNTAVLVEILSLSNICLNPFIYLMLKCDLAYFKSVMLKFRQWRYSSRSALNNKDLGLHPHCYESSQSKTCEASFVKLIN